MTRILYFDHLLTGQMDLALNGANIIHGGSSIPKSKRPVNSVYTAFRLDFSPGEEKHLMFRDITPHVLNTKVLMTDELSFYKINIEKMGIFKIYTGAMVALLLYNFFIALFTKSKVFFIYCFYLAALYLTVMGSQGVLDYVDIFSQTTLSHYLIVFSTLSLISSFLFAQEFLDTRKYFPSFKYVVRYGVLLATFPLAYAFSPWFNSGTWVFGNYIDILIAISIIVCISSGIIVSIRKNKLGYIYLLSWSFVFLGAFLYLGSLHGVLPRNYILNNGLLFGNIFEMLILSLGLGYQIIILKQEKEAALEEAKVKDKLQRLIRVVSHDIANSLQVAILYLTSAAKQSEQKDVKTRISEALKASENIKQILDHVRVEQKLEEIKEHIDNSPVVLTDALDKVLFLFQEQMKQKNISVITEICPRAEVMAEETTLINNVLGNIISNAIKFSPTNGKIYITCSPSKGNIELEIKDQGEGFPETILEQFNKKKSILSTLGTYGESGTGFGLRIIETYMELYQGASLKIFNDQGAVYRLSFRRV